MRKKGTQNKKRLLVNVSASLLLLHRPLPLSTVLSSIHLSGRRERRKKHGLLVNAISSSFASHLSSHCQCARGRFVSLS